MTERRTSDEIIQKIESFIHVVYSKLKDQPEAVKIQGLSLAKELNVPPNTLSIMQEIGLIKKVGLVDHTSTYIWADLDEEPNFYHATEIHKRVNEKKYTKVGDEGKVEVVKGGSAKLNKRQRQKLRKERAEKVVGVDAEPKKKRTYNKRQGVVSKVTNKVGELSDVQKIVLEILMSATQSILFKGEQLLTIKALPLVKNVILRVNGITLLGMTDLKFSMAAKEIHLEILKGQYGVGAMIVGKEGVTLSYDKVNNLLDIRTIQ